MKDRRNCIAIGVTELVHSPRIHHESRILHVGRNLCVKQHSASCTLLINIVATHRAHVHPTRTPLSIERFRCEIDRRSLTRYWFSNLNEPRLFVHFLHTERDPKAWCRYRTIMMIGGGCQHFKDTAPGSADATNYNELYSFTEIERTHSSEFSILHYRRTLRRIKCNPRERMLFFRI